MVSEVDEWVGKNLVVLREDAGQSQQDLAAAMREKGHKWSQSTVWSVEKADRPLRLSEAVDLAKHLNRPLDDLYRPTVEVEAETLLRRHAVLLLQLSDRLCDTAVLYEHRCRVMRNMANLVLEQIEISDSTGWDARDYANHLLVEVPETAQAVLAEDGEMNAAWKRLEGSEGVVRPGGE